MNFDELRDKGIIEPVTVDAAEIANLLRVARRDIATAESLLGTDYDWAFAVAYNAVLQSSVAYMAQCGFRPANRNKHYNTFRFMKQALSDQPELASRLQRFRKKRNTTVYESVGAVGETEVRDIIAFAPLYVDMIRQRLPHEVQRLLAEDD
jgi:uncharacterized protein (UPF0332 family)